VREKAAEKFGSRGQNWWTGDKDRAFGPRADPQMDECIVKPRDERRLKLGKVAEWDARQEGGRCLRRERVLHERN
jgi:hypothetical protein